MTVDQKRWDRIWGVFHDAVETPPEQRDAFLADACSGDTSLEREVRELIEQHDASQGFLAEPATFDAGIGDGGPGEDSLVGQLVDLYRIRAVIGEGGMGVVYDAEQERPVRRRVALKLIKLGMDTREVIARFENERQALALMNHPNIASVLDGGVTDSGRPYFVMEYVAGVPITDYCDQHRVAIADRLALFMRLCKAIEHAHQKGIIHRDIKPSNVLVAMQDGQPVPKVIDFGVAKALNQRLTELTVFTAIGRFIGTPEYMSPEQAESSGLDVDTRTDIYSLGVLLYKLLCGSLPLDGREMTSGDYATLRQTIRDREPRRPSDQVTAGERSIARERGVEFDALRKQLRGDLDWIVMRALEKDRTRRYQTASEFEDDIRRYLANEPVLAGPPGATYRARKFVRRHRLAVASVAVLTIVVGAFAAMMTVQSLSLSRALATADIERERAQEVTGFLVDLFEQTDPVVAQGREVTVREALDRGSEQLAGELNEQPLLKATLRETIGKVYLALGAYPQSIDNLADAVALRRGQYGDEHPDVARALALMGRTRATQGKYDEAEDYYSEALATQRRTLGDGHAELATTLNELGFLLTLQGRYDEAESMQQEGLEMRLALFGERHEDVGLSYNDLAITFRRMNRYEEAEQYYRTALSIWREVYGDRNTQVATLLNNLGVLLHVSGRFEAAREAFAEALSVRREQLGNQHYYTGLTINNLAGVHIETGDFRRAEDMYREALAIHTAAIGPESPESLSARSNVARAIYEQGDFGEAERMFREVLEGRRRVLDPSDPQIANAQSWLARTLIETGQTEEANRLARSALATFEESLAPGHWRIALAQSTLGRIAGMEGDLVEAERLLVPAIDVLKARRGEKAQVTLRSQAWLDELMSGAANEGG